MIHRIFFFLFLWLPATVLLSQPVLDLRRAQYLSGFAATCIAQEYPNKPGHVLGSDASLRSPRALHPVFYGCFDWHSAVHGHWTLVSLLSRFEGLEERHKMIAALQQLLTAENVMQEVAYFDDPNNRDFERPYGWAWLLKLDEALALSNQAWAAPLHQNLQPLTKLIAEKMKQFLLKLNYPIRVGEHTNVAFAMSLALDWADRYDHNLAQIIRQRAVDYYANDKKCPISWEPGGFDFISPCMQEAALMAKVLDKKAFDRWFRAFLPGFTKKPETMLIPAESPDRSDGKMAHLDGLNFNRAWCLAELAKATGNQKFLKGAVLHFEHSFSKLDSGEYAGAHWLASFATLALIRIEEAL